MNVHNQIRQQCFDMEMRLLDATILLNTIDERLDRFADLSESDMEHSNAVSCFVTSALRNVALLRGMQSISSRWPRRRASDEVIAQSR
jgi:hypothetical protein